MLEEKKRERRAWLISALLIFLPEWLSFWSELHLADRAKTFCWSNVEDHEAPKAQLGPRKDDDLQPLK